MYGCVCVLCVFAGQSLNPAHGGKNQRLFMYVLAGQALNPPGSEKKNKSGFLSVSALVVYM